MTFLEWVVMPNHIHFVVVIPSGLSLGRVVGAYKSLVDKGWRAICEKTPAGKVWQRNYYEHVVRNEQDMVEIRRYIQENPLNWERDELYMG